MFTAELASDRTAVALPGASAVEMAGAQLVDVVVAAELARTGKLRCLDPHCDAALVYNNGSANTVGAMTRRPHWRHPAGSALGCAASGGPEGEWHQYVKLSILAAAECHEQIVADSRARCDAVIRRKGGGTATAVEVQHSTISPATIRRRHDAHRDAGFEATIWLIDGLGLVPGSDLAGWSDPAVEHPGTRTARGLVHNVALTRSWVIDLIEECRRTVEETGYRCTVGILIPPVADVQGTPSMLGADTHVLRFVEDLTVMEIDGRRAAVSHKFSRPVTESALRIWAAGPHREHIVRDHPLASEIRCLDAASKRSVRSVHSFFDIAERRGRVRIGFTGPHEGNKRSGEALGLTWAPGCNDICGQGHAGHLVGARTVAVDTWLAVRFDSYLAEAAAA